MFFCLTSLTRHVLFCPLSLAAGLQCHSSHQKRHSRATAATSFALTPSISAAQGSPGVLYLYVSRVIELCQIMLKGRTLWVVQRMTASHALPASSILIFASCRFFRRINPSAHLLQTVQIPRITSRSRKAAFPLVPPLCTSIVDSRARLQVSDCTTEWTLQPTRLLFSYLARCSMCIKNVHVFSVGSDAQLHRAVSNPSAPSSRPFRRPFQQSQGVKFMN
jgi:hypothetical protein